MNIIKLYTKEVLRHPFLLLAVIVGDIGVQISGLVTPLYLRQMFNTLASHDTSVLVVHNILVTVGIIGTIYFLQWLFGRMHVYASIALEPKVIENLYFSAFDYLIRHSHNFFASQFAGTLTRRVSKYVESFQDIFGAVIENFLSTAVFITGAVVILFLHNHTLGIILGVWSVCFISIQIFLSSLHRPHRVFRAEQGSRMIGALSDSIGNQSAVTLFAAVSHEHEKFAYFVNKWINARTKSWTFMANIWSVQSFLMIGINIALLYGAVIFWARGELTIGDFVLIQTYLIGTFALLNNVTQRLRSFYDALADAEEMVAILDKPHEIQDVPNALRLTVSKGVINFRDVTFHFHEERSILDHLNLSISHGEKVALVGPSGAGKSTITKLLLRMYDVTGGSIEIDGQNISQVKQDSLREVIGFVPQEPVLFHRSLMENIRYGKRDATDEEVIEASKKAHCHEFIEGLREGYDTFVGERGVKLSGGERQRVAIARAILKDAPILILDEATSSLDSESEALIQDSIKILMQGKTVLVIAHRLSTIMNMDQIIVLQDGAIVADGTHADLLTQGGLYQKLWSIQAGGFIQDE